MCMYWSMVASAYFPYVSFFDTHERIEVISDIILYDKKLFVNLSK